MKKTITITTYRELFELWSTNKSFQKEYPYLPLLHTAFGGILEPMEDETPIENYLRTGYKTQLKDEDIKTYFFPYYDNIYLKDNKIDILQKSILSHFYRYVMDRKLPIVNASNTSINCLVNLSDEALKNISVYLPETDINGKRFKPEINHMKLYDVTQKECYKPTAYDLLRDIAKNIELFEKIMVFIKVNNCVWPDKEKNRNYTFIKNKKDNLDKIEFIKFLAYDEDKKMWRKDFCMAIPHNKHFIEICKRYNIDINTIADNGSYLVHYAIQQFGRHPTNWLLKLLDNGAKLVDENGELLKGELDWSLYRFNSSIITIVHDFLMEYYKDNKVMQDKLVEEYDKFLTKPLKSVTLTVEVEEEPSVDPNIKSLLCSIQDQNIRDKMTAYYIKLLLDKQ